MIFPLITAQHGISQPTSTQVKLHLSTKVEVYWCFEAMEKGNMRKGKPTWRLEKL